MRPGKWQPILVGDSKRRAVATIAAIAAHLSRPRWRKLGDPSLAGGQAGLALFFAYLARTRPGQGHEDTAIRFLHDAVAAASTCPVQKSLYGGVTGIA